MKSGYGIASTIGNLQTLTGPAEEPLTLIETKAHCRVDIDEDDDLLTGYIVAAREWVENHCRRRLVTQTVRLTMDEFPGGSEWACAGTLNLYGGSVQSITSVTYLDAAGDSQSYSTYTADLTSEPARLRPALDQNWPQTRHQMAAVAVTYVVGYPPAGSPEDLTVMVPQSIKHAMKMMIAHWYENRETVHIGQSVLPVPMAAEMLLAPYRCYWF